MTIVAGLHGNEYAPVAYLRRNQIPFVLGNPGAMRKDVRFLDNDLNASFGIDKKGYEYRRAKILLKKIREPVIDFHTFSCDSEPFAVIVDLKMLHVACKTGVKHVVYMDMNIKNGHSLINYVDGVSIEAGRHDDPNVDKCMRSVLTAYKSGLVFKPKLYRVYGIIEKPERCINFQKKKDFYPVLAGEKAYKFYGLKAKLCSYQ